MGLTNFPHGVSSFGLPMVGSGAILTTGNVFFVNSSHAKASNGNVGTDPGAPLATIDYAVGKCTANNGDHIIVGPGHVETLTTAGGLDLDVAGITIVGIGTGSLQPQVVHDAAAADVDVDAANVTIRNIHFVASFADVAISVDVNADDCWLDGCRWTDEATNLNFVDYVHVGSDGVADGLKITDCWAVGNDAANDGFLNCAGDLDRLVFQRNFVKLAAVTGEPVIEVAGKSLTNCLITHNWIFRPQTSGDVFIASDQTDNSGIVAYNAIGCLDIDTTIGAVIDLTGALLLENVFVGEVDKNGYFATVTTGS